MTVRRFFATLRMTILGDQSLYFVSEFLNTDKGDEGHFNLLEFLIWYAC